MTTRSNPPDVLSGTDIRLTMSASNGRGLFLERSEMDKKAPVRQNSTRDAQSQNIKHAPFERILLSVVAEGPARLSVRQSGRFDGMTLGHDWAPYLRSSRLCFGACYSNLFTRFGREVRHGAAQALCWLVAELHVAIRTVGTTINDAIPRLVECV